MERRFALALAASSVAGHLVLMIWLGNASSGWLERAWASGFGLWVCGPFLVPLALLVFFRRLSGAWIAAGMLLANGLSVWAYGESFFGERVDAQAALVFVFVPVYQYPLMALASALAAWRGAKSAAPSAG